MDRFFSRLALVALLAVAPLTFALAYDEAGDPSADANVDSYDTILNQLNKETAKSTSRLNSMNTGTSPFDDVWIHAGIGLAGIVQDISFADGQQHTLNNRGIQAALGIDLFSEHWLAEGTARSFGENEDGPVRASVQEFEMRVIFKDRLAPKANFKFGAGLSGRYLTVKRFGEATIEYSTPMSIATTGLEMYLADRFSIGLDFNGRFAMIGETIDKNSFDATLRMDTHF
ncbi:MAG: hypothetical protein AAB250_14095 [Bdellovibrionota bacterium]